MAAVVVVNSQDELGRYVLERARREARDRGVPLVIAAGVSIPRTEDQAGRYAELRAQVEAALEASAAEAREDDLEVRTYIPAAPVDAADAALEAAAEHEAELIVVGLSKRSPVGKFVLGSMSQDILLGAQCDVLGVRLPE